MGRTENSVSTHRQRNFYRPHYRNFCVKQMKQAIECETFNITRTQKSIKNYSGFSLGYYTNELMSLAFYKSKTILDQFKLFWIGPNQVFNLGQVQKRIFSVEFCFLNHVQNENLFMTLIWTSPKQFGWIKNRLELIEAQGNSYFCQHRIVYIKIFLDSYYFHFQNSKILMIKKEIQ